MSDPARTADHFEGGQIAYPDCPGPLAAAAAQGRPLVVPGWGLGDAVLAIVGAFVFAVAVALGIEAVYPGGASPLGPTVILGTTVPWLALAGWPLLITGLRGNGPRLDLGLQLGWADLRWGLAAGVAAFVFGSIAATITQAVFGDFSSAAGNVGQEIADSGQLVWLVGFALLIAVGAPIAEEIAFRGLLWASLVKRGARPWFALTVTTVVFALFHFEFQRLLVLLVIGACLGAARWRSAGLGASMFAHALNNIPGAIALLLLTR